MKTLKLIILFIIPIVFTGILQAGNPSNMKAEDRAKVIVEKLCKDVVLTDSQKVAIEIKAKEFMVKMDNSNKQKTKEVKHAQKKEASSSYRAVLDSILTFEQKDQLMLKQNERKEAIITKNQNNPQ